MLAGEFQEAVDRYADVPPRLAARGVLGQETSERLRGLAGFRNVLVHDYGRATDGSARPRRGSPCATDHRSRATAG